jgi:hypothetical protein
MESAFVMQLRREPDLELGIFAGRVEHVDSGCSTRFETIDEFLKFVVSSIIRSEAGAESK